MPIFRRKKKEEKKITSKTPVEKIRKSVKKTVKKSVKKTVKKPVKRLSLSRKRASSRKKKTVKITEKKEKKGSGGIEFCKKCGSIMLPEKKGYLRCRSCGYTIKKSVRDLKIVEEKEKANDVIVLENDETILPTVDKMCPKCENMRAHYWLQQTRSADEPPTQFFRCTKCKHVWREYK